MTQKIHIRICYKLEGYNNLLLEGVQQPQKSPATAGLRD
jgi:hypothetical protein